MSPREVTLSGTERLQIRAWVLKAERQDVEACPGPHCGCYPGQQILSSHETTQGIEQIHLKCLALCLAWMEGTAVLVIALLLIIVTKSRPPAEQPVSSPRGLFHALVSCPAKVKHSSSALALPYGMKLNERGLPRPGHREAELQQEEKCTLWAAACVITIIARHRWATEHPH